MKRISTKPPSWFTHILYATNLTALLIYGWWITGAFWALIWLLSWLTHRKISQKKLKEREQRNPSATKPHIRKFSI